MGKRTSAVLAVVAMLGGTAAAVVPVGAEDPLPTVSVADAAADEHEGVVVVTVSLSAPTTTEVTVRYRTTPGTALAGSDYVPSYGTVTFAPGEQHKDVTIALVDDFVIESTGSELFNVRLTDVSAGATFGDRIADAVIFDDDAKVSVLDASADESEGTISFKLSLTGYVSAFDPELPERGFAVDFATVAQTATDADFVPATGTVVFDGLAEFVTITLTDDGLDEPLETFGVVLSNPQNLAIGRQSATGTITDDD